MAADRRIGTDLAGYRIIDVVGRGGMGVVYLAEHTGLQRRAALKILAPELAADRAFRERFAAESRLAASIEHPNIVPIYEAGEVDGTLFIAMRYVEGDDLRQRLDSDGSFDPERVVRLLAPIADALDAAHAVGLVHRDVKAANILLDRRDDHPYLTDFGLTKQTRTDGGGLTQTGQFLGTPGYVAPEQLASGRIDGRADQYSLACVAFEMLSGTVPYARDSDLATLFAHATEPPPDVRTLRPDLAPGLSAVFARGLARRPDERFPDCGAFVAAIAGSLVARSGPSAGRQTAPPEPTAREVVICPECGASNATRARFCSDCATPLGSTGPTSTREMRKLVTILFADVAGSTELGERLDPETLRALLHRYFEAMRRIIEAHGGTVEKYIGDAVMAVFGIPVVHEDDALRAVRAADAIRTELAALDAEVGASRGVTIRFRTGINTGEVVAGGSASGATMVTGDPVNTAARLEAAAPAGEILLGRLTWQLVRDAVTVEPVEPISAKGKADPLPAYRLLAVDPDVAGHIRRLDTPLVGREPELAALLNAFERVASERSCQLFTLLGTAGIGKSRLVAEFVAAIEAEATVLRGRCLSYGEGITYWPIAEILRTTAGIEETDSAETARARLRARLEGERDADVIAARLASAIGLSIEAAPQEEVFWAIRKAFEHLASDRPLVVVIEDIHWAEPTLLDLIEHIADWSREAPILLLCPARPELLDLRSGWGGGKLNVTNVLLEPLGADATTRLISALPGGSALPPSVEARVTQAAEGNPLYVEELLAMLVDDDLLRQASDGSWSASDGLAEVRIPASISALLSARLERLAPDEREVAERASIVGRVFEQAAVFELAGDALRPAVGRTLLALVRKELVRPDRSELTPGDAFKFRHILIRDAAYEALPKSERAALHERFADWLERTVGARLVEYEEIVGYHLEQAHRYRTELGETDDHVVALAVLAGTHLAAASERSLERGDLAGAMASSNRASRLLPIGSPRRLRLLLDLAFVHFSFGDVARSEQMVRDAADEAKVAGQPVLAIHAELEQALLHVLISSERLEPRSIAIAAIPRLEREGDELGLARANLVLASAAWMGGQVLEATKARDRATAHAERAGDRTLTSRTVFWGAEFYGPTPALEAIQDLESRLGEASQNPLARAQNLFSLAGLYAIRGRADDARNALRAMSSILVDVGTRLWSGVDVEVKFEVEMALGDALAAERFVREGIDRMIGSGATGYLNNMHSLVAMALAGQGRWEIALSVAEQVSRDAHREDVLVQITIEKVRSIVWRAMGDTTMAVQAGLAGVNMAAAIDWSSFRSGLWMTLAEALRSDARPEEARGAAAEALRLAVEKQDLMAERRAAAFLAGS